MTRSPGVLFDVDGTLVDTNYLHTIAWARALDDVGEWAPMNAIHRLIGMGGDQMLPRLIGTSVEGGNGRLGGALSRGDRRGSGLPRRGRSAAANARGWPDHGDRLLVSA